MIKIVKNAAGVKKETDTCIWGEDKTFVESIYLFVI
jgi:hypothetical protein